MSPEQTSLAFRENTVRALEDSALRAAMKQATDTFGTKRADAFAPVADLEALREMKKSHPLVDASTLCGACVEVCPVRVPLVDLILGLLRRKVRDRFADPREQRGMEAFGKAAASPALFALGQRLAGVAALAAATGRLAGLPGRPVL